MGKVGQNEKQWYKPSEVAKLFGVTPRTVNRWIELGKVAAITLVSGHRRISKDEVERLQKNVGGGTWRVSA